MLSEYEFKALGIFVGRNPSPLMHITSAAGFRGQKQGKAAKGRKVRDSLIAKGLIVRDEARPEAMGEYYAITPSGRKAWLQHTPTVH